MTASTAGTRAPGAASRAAMAAFAVLCCAGLAVAAVWVNSRAACASHDAPYAEVSCDAGADTDSGRLLMRLRANPADLEALKFYARTHPAAIPVLAGVWPTDPEVLKLRVSAAIGKARWSEAAEPLTLLAHYESSEPAAQLIARMAAGGQSAVFYPYLRPGSLWLRQALRAAPRAQVPPTALAPLVSRAMATKAIDPATVGFYIEQLKAASAWVDAYALWVALNGGGVPLLFNGGFDLPFKPDGFDWRMGAQPEGGHRGVFVERVPNEGGGFALLVRFNGKAFQSPLVSQDLFLVGGPVRVRGQYLTRRLRSEHGLRWVAVCADSRAAAGRSGELIDSTGRWQAFDFRIDPPDGCGPVTRLQLEMADGVEAKTGATGQVLFDSLVVEPATSAVDAKGSR